MDRIKEKSTWIGLVTLVVTLAGFQLAPDQLEAIAGGAAALASIALIVIREKKGDE